MPSWRGVNKLDSLGGTGIFYALGGVNPPFPPPCPCVIIIKVKLGYSTSQHYFLARPVYCSTDFFFCAVEHVHVLPERATQLAVFVSFFCLEIKFRC